jgi:urea transport system permease protein
MASRLRALCALALVTATASIAAADGGELAELGKKLGSDDRTLMSEAISGLGRSEDPAALTILVALRDGKLKTDAHQTLLISGDAGVTDALTGKPVNVEKASLKTIIPNNVLRRALGPALAELQLKSKDTAIRLEAAQALGKAGDEKMGPAMRAALAKETDPAVKAQLTQTLAQIDFSSSDPKLRIGAIRAMAEGGDIAFKSMLAPLLEKDSSGKFKEANEAVREAAGTALGKIERQELVARILRDLFYGLSLGSVLLLAAIGLAVTFGLMRVINMAHGEMLMLGAYSTYVAQLLFQKYLPSAMNWYLLLAVPLAFVVCMAIGMLLERSVIRFLYGRPLETLLSTWGISLILIQVVRLVFGAQNVAVSNPSWLSGGIDLMVGVTLPYNRIATILFVVAVVMFVAWLLRRTSLGLQVRAITQNRAMAACMGIKTKQIDMLTFGLGSGLAGLGGVALSQIGNVGPELGQHYIVDSFMVVVVGGVGKIAGSVIAAIGLGTINKVLEPFAGAVLGKIFVLVFVVLFIQRRPQGLFALKGRSAES